MREKKSSEQKMCFTALLLTLSLMGTGCGDGRQTGDSSHPSQTVVSTGTTLKTGAMSYGYFYVEDGISLSSTERFMYSDWEPVEFDYICMDPTCSHLTGSCGARAISGEGDVKRDFSLVYQDRLIILHGYSQFVDNESSESVWDYSTVYQTDVYEADPDGSNRRKVATFSGAIDSPIITYAAVLVDGKLYFGGATEVRDRTEQNTQSGAMTNESWVSDAVYCLDLNDYTLETFAATENWEGMAQYQLYEYDGMVYVIMSDFSKDRAIWYRIAPEAGRCEEILRFDSNVARFQGAIGNTVYYKYENSGKTLYARDVSAGAKEREIMTVTGEDMTVNAFITDGQILFMTDCRLEEEEPMTEYAVLDPEGKILDRIRYDDYITFLDVVGDKLIYYRTYSDCDEWWAEKENLKVLTEGGVPIGPFWGAGLDTLAEQRGV
ncbi:MAG: hypothetical protein NC123_00405 [Butyrivibrio sp.]|nr:hypothetical protein [Acetatifactor muris]MCM1557996.1 hypothetical protein [Butyrivibrio sp.]